MSPLNSSRRLALDTDRECFESPHSRLRGWGTPQPAAFVSATPLIGCRKLTAAPGNAFHGMLSDSRRCDRLVKEIHRCSFFSLKIGKWAQPVGLGSISAGPHRRTSTASIRSGEALP